MYKNSIYDGIVIFTVDALFINTVNGKVNKSTNVIELLDEYYEPIEIHRVAFTDSGFHLDSNGNEEDEFDYIGYSTDEFENVLIPVSDFVFSNKEFVNAGHFSMYKVYKIMNRFYYKEMQNLAGEHDDKTMVDGLIVRNIDSYKIHEPDKEFIEQTVKQLKKLM